MKKQKDDIKFLIKDNLHKIKSHRPKLARMANPNLLNDQKQQDAEAIGKLLEELTQYCEELQPFISQLKNNISDIAEQSHLCAIYLLMCFNLQTWQSIYMLSREGFYSQTMSLIRIIKESSMICSLFSLEKMQNKEQYLKKWFSGEIISHSNGRKAEEEFFEKNSPCPEIDLKRLQSYIYQMESQPAHCSYASMLENISPFSEDFDLEMYTGFRRVIPALNYAKGSMEDMNITLKSIYLIMLKDSSRYNELDTILIKHNPRYKNATVSEDVLKMFKKKTEQ